MNYICRASGCGSPASTRYGQYCHSHKAQLRRHGAVGQRAITKADLKPYRALIAARLEKNRAQPLTTQLVARWKAVVTHATGIVDLSSRGKPMARFQREAAVEVLRLSNGVNGTDLVGTILALYVMQDQDPLRFKDETAFRTQLVRRVRGLTFLNADTWIDSATGRGKRVYRDLSARTVAIISQWLVEAFGAAGIHFAKLERHDAERKLKSVKDFHQALGAMR